MDAQLKAKWVEALRSGKYEQAQGSLIEDHEVHPRRFCCLGVLCDVTGAEWTDPEFETGVLQGMTIRDKNGSYLSPEILGLVGLSNSEQRLLAEKNDNGESFTEIADHIEAHL